MSKSYTERADEFLDELNLMALRFKELRAPPAVNFTAFELGAALGAGARVVEISSYGSSPTSFTGNGGEPPAYGIVYIRPDGSKANVACSEGAYKFAQRVISDD